MLRIAHIIQSVGDRSGGTSTAFVQVMGALATQKDLEPVAYTLRPGATDAANLEIAAHPDRWRLADSLGRLGPGHLGAMAAADVAGGGIDVLHLHGVWSPDLLAAAAAARRAGVPCCWQPHGMLLDHALAQKPLKKKLYLRLGLARALRFAAAYVFCTGGERDHTLLPRGSDPSRGRVVFLPVTVPGTDAEIARYREEGRAKFGFAEGAPVLGFMGRFHPVKRIELTLRAFAGAAERELPGAARLALFGSGDEAYTSSLRSLAAELGIADRVVFAGWTGGEDKWRALAAADGLIINSRHENFGYTVPEALGVRTPVVMTGNLSLAPDVAGVAAGWSADPFARIVEPTPEALAGAIRRVLTAPPSPVSREAGRRWVEQTFSPGAIGAQLRALYLSLPARAQRSTSPAAAPR